MLHKKDVASCTKMCYTNNVNKKWKKGWHKYIKSIIIEKKKGGQNHGIFR